MKKMVKKAGKILGWFLLIICFVFCSFAFEMEGETSGEKWMLTVIEILTRSSYYFMIADIISEKRNRKLCGIGWVILVVVGVEVLPLCIDSVVITMIKVVAPKPGILKTIYLLFMKSLISLEYLLRVGLWSLFGIFVYFWGEKTVRFLGKKLHIINSDEVVSVTNKFIYFPQGTIADGPVSVIKDEEDHIVILPHSEEEAHEAPYWVVQGKICMDGILFDLLDCEKYILHNHNGTYLLTWEELYVRTTN